MKLEEIFAEVFAIPQSTVVDALALEDISTWDSMAHILLVVHLEETYKVQFTGDEIANIRSVRDVRFALTTRGVKV